MQRPIKWGLILGGAVAVETLVFGVAGWHTIASMAFVFLAIAVAINVVTVVLCLRETAPENAWGGQLRNGLTLGLVGSVVIFLTMWFVTVVVFPDYFVEMAEGYREAYESMGLSQEAIDESVARVAASSPVRSALEAVVGTIVVSFVGAAVTAIWVRRKD